MLEVDIDAEAKTMGEIGDMLAFMYKVGSETYVLILAELIHIGQERGIAVGSLRKVKCPPQRRSGERE